MNPAHVFFAIGILVVLLYLKDVTFYEPLTTPLPKMYRAEIKALLRAEGIKTVHWECSEYLGYSVQTFSVLRKHRLLANQILSQIEDSYRYFLAPK